VVSVSILVSFSRMLNEDYMPLLSPKQVAAELNMSANTVRRLLKSGELTGRKFGGQWRVKPGDLSLSESSDKENREGDQ